MADLARTADFGHDDGVTPLGRELAARIRRSGPIGIDTFMAAALADPRYGYYATHDPFGVAGDFVTAPEISQIFGDVIGAWCVAVWEALGSPAPFSLVELGPGRGTLAADIARALKLRPAARRACTLHLVETSPALGQRQRETLARLCCDVPAHWHSGVDGLPEQPAIMVANEFFDALPIRQFIRRGGGWRERVIDCAADGFDFAEAALPSRLENLPSEGPEGAIFEINEPAGTIAGGITDHVARFRGAVLIIDYGHEVSACGDTLQAVRAHRSAPPLSEPGECDLTAHVDFAAIARRLAAGGLNVYGPVTQRRFLLDNGAALRARRLAAGQSRDAAATIESGLNRLIDPAMMGVLFKVMAACSPDLSLMPGFAPDQAIEKSS